MLLEASRQRIIELFQRANINVTDVLHADWVEDKDEQVEIKYRPKMLAKLLGLKLPKPKTITFRRDAYEIGLEIDGSYRLYLKVDDLKALRLVYKTKPGLFFESLVPQLERVNPLAQMELVWEELIKRVEHVIPEIENAKRDLRPKSPTN